MKSAALLFLLVALANGTGLWETSRIWPSINGVELYDDDADFIHTLRQLPSWKRLDVDKPNESRVDAILQVARERWEAFFSKIVPKHAENHPVNPQNKALVEITSVTVLIRDPACCLQKIDTDESYEIIVNESSVITLHAETVYGILHALETLKQLVDFGWMDSTDHTTSVATLPGHVLILDRPLYSYRGLLIDTSRHFLPKQLILDNLDLLAANKMNVLHWHLTDSQSFPWASETYPELAQRGAYCSTTCVYEASDIRDIVDAAAKRGIRVIVEVDLPGHSQVIGRSHPELMSQCGDRGPSEPLDATNPAVHDFVLNIYNELVDLFPDPWMHIGGDEVPLGCWKDSQTIQDWMKVHNMTRAEQVLEYFEIELVHMVESHRRTAIAWQDLFEMGVVLPANVIFDVWKEGSRKQMSFNITSQGHDVVVSAGYYLDYLNHDWRWFYTQNPRDFGNATLQSHVLGGHSSMWGERVDETNFFPRVWPRTSSVAEVLWSGSPTVNDTSPLHLGKVQDRLDRFRCKLLQEFGLPIAPVWTGYCEYQDNDSVVDIMDTPRDDPELSKG